MEGNDSENDDEQDVAVVAVEPLGNEQENPIAPHLNREQDTTAIVTSDDGAGEMSEDDEQRTSLHYGAAEAEHGPHFFHADELYDANLDQEDESYVYQTLRGGSGDGKTTAPETTTNRSSQTTTTMPARKSDAVLSCPLCFNILCMDCQRHERYHDQYRAMFVMGIAVDWSHRLVYDPKVQGLVRFTEEEASTESVGSRLVPDHDPVHYYAVSCANCHTMVAALDMEDEVYHFHGCLASS